MSMRERLQEFDQLVRQGRAPTVARALLAQSKSRIPHELLADFGNLARRVGLPSLGLRILRPTLLRAAELGEPAPSPMVASYAASLAAIGAHAEALALLEPHAGEMRPEVQLYLGYIHLYRWNYADAAPYFLRYLECDGLTEYQRAIARLNLAACLNFLGDVASLAPLLDQLSATAEENHWHILLRDTLMTSAGMMIELKDWKQARSALSRGLAHADRQGADTLLLRKWRLILDLHEFGWDPKTHAALAELRTEAAQRGKSEVIRDCDYHEALISQNTRLMKKVYFGSSFASYRSRIETKTAGWFRPGTRFRYALIGRHGPLFDLGSGQFMQDTTVDGELALKLLQVLSSDLYQPLWIASIFSSLYPGEAFDLDSSSVRVRQTILRARRELERIGCPIRIDCRKNRYLITAASPADLGLLLSYEGTPRPIDETPSLKALRKSWPYRAFSLRQASSVFGGDARKAKSAIQSGESRGLLVRTGQGRATLYRFRE